MIRVERTEKPDIGIPLDLDNPLTEGILVDYAFNEGAGGKAYDGRNGNDGQWNGTGEHWNAGAAQFSGDDYISVAAPAGSDLDALTQFTVVADVFATTGDSMIVQRFEWNTASPTDLQFYIEADADLRFFLSNRILLWPGFTLNKRHFLVFTYDGVTMKIYSDGILRAEVGEADVAQSTSEPWLIGVDSDATGGGSLGNYYTGLMDQILIYNRALTEADIVALSINSWQRFQPELIPFVEAVANDLLLLENTNLRGNLQDLRGGLR